MIHAGFAAADITPPLGTAKIGNLGRLVGNMVADPLRTRVCVLEDETVQFALVQLDTLSVSRAHVATIRAKVRDRLGFPGENVMLTATHTHAGPAIIRSGEVEADRGYQALVTDAVLRAFEDALGRSEAAEIGFARTVEHEVAKNRRVVLRNGTVRTHGIFDDSEASFLEGPIDPELTVIGVRADSERWLGCVVNFACHPTDHGDDDVFSAGFPGVLASRLRGAGIPVTLFVNGAMGNLHPADPFRGGRMMSMDEVGRRLAARVGETLPCMAFRDRVSLEVGSKIVHLPFRELTPEEIAGTARGAQRFAGQGPYNRKHWAAMYERMISDVMVETDSEKAQAAEVQVAAIDEYAIVGIPAELFVELGLAIKETAYPLRALVAGLANGMIGYVPHRQAFLRGGYETTLSTMSKLAPEAGPILVDTAARLLQEVKHTR